MLAQKVNNREPITASKDEYRAIENAIRILEAQSQTMHNVRLVGPNNEVVELPPSIYELLHRVLPRFLRGNSIAIVQYPEELTIYAAADLLNVSNRYVDQLCDEGAFPFTESGALRLIRYVDLIQYRRKRDEQRRQGLREMTQESQALGHYDTPEPMPEEEPD